MTRWLADFVEQRPLVAVAALVASLLLSFVAIFVVLVAPSPSAAPAASPPPEFVTRTETLTRTVERTQTVTTTRTVAATARSQTVFALPTSATTGRPVELSWVSLRTGTSTEEVEVRRGGRVVGSFETDPSRAVRGQIYEVRWRGGPRRSGTFEFCVRATVGGERGPWSCAPLEIAR